MSQLLDLRAAARAAAPFVPELPHLRDAAIATWRARMVNEHGSARVFSGLAQQLRAAGMADDAVACEQFADEERRHGVLCGAVVEGLGGDALARPLEEVAFPLHDEVGRLEAVVRNALSIGCLSETVAVALIGAERLGMDEGPLRALLTEILADEVGHARFGWQLVGRIVPALSPTERARVGAYLTVAFAALEAHELAHLPTAVTPPPEGAQLGLCSGTDARALFWSTVDEVIVPRLSSLGLDARRAWCGRHRVA